ncbi:lipoprotein [Paucisalibacillus sp. EB02]|uniref:lipoprotein n=1 Tax=Paucisalibacillus sp. EB02 TaxID=1347087 RepID=UPI0005A6F7E3|nr:lipoprotein [Paucisalibacillus sp. EB02]
MKKIIIVIGLLLLLSACGNEKEKEASVSKTSPDVYAKFQNIDIQIEQKQARIVGDANASGNEFYYQVEQGEKTLKTEEMVKVGSEWGDFEIIVEITDEMEQADDIVIVHMYTKDEEGSIINPNYVPLDLDIEQE